MSEQGHGTCIGYPINNIPIEIICISDDPIEKWSDDLVAKENEIGEIAVKGELVTRQYYNRPEADALAKIKDGTDIWHRMGDLGRKDDKGRIWFYGRKSHRVITAGGTLFTIPCEAIFNNHPQVNRSALVGVGPRPHQQPVICIERVKSASAKGEAVLKNELLEIAGEHELTRQIKTVLFHKAFPVDIRHLSAPRF